MTDPALSYPGAPATLVARWDARRDPLRFGPGEGLPAPDCDLAALAATPLYPPRTAPGSSFGAKRAELAREMEGGSELALLHGLLIACLRKRSWPDHAPALFRRLWAEQRHTLIDQLSGRWLISAAITFADHGETEAQRRLGQSLNLLFSLMKLYEYERLHSGLPPERPYPPGRRSRAALPMGMPGFSLAAGGLDINLLAPIWAEAQAEPLLGPLACHLLDRLNADPGALFRRLGSLKARAARRRAALLDRAPDIG